MINSEHLCMGCMKEIGEVQQCPHCGFHADTMQMAPYLAVRTVVANRYLIGKLLEYNGDGATYIAWDINEKKPVTIREFLPDTLATRRVGEKEVTVMSGCELSYRECMADFVELWRKLTRMSGLSALVNVFDVFEENSTAYAICEYVKSITLRDYLLRLKTGYIPWEKARALFMPVLSTLGMLHTAGIIHRGISPLTLQIGQDGKMRIGGFSIWQARTAKSDLSAQLFPGYAAIEQYGFEGKQGPGTDIYAFAATLYRALIGSDPIEATERLTNDKLMVPGRFAEQLPAYVINGLINALQIMPEERTRSVEQLRADLSASPVAAAASGTEFEVPAAPPVPPSNPQPSGKQPVQKSQQGKPAKKDSKMSENKVIIIRTALISAIVGLVIFLIVVIAAGDKLGFSIKEPETEVVTRQEMVAVPNFVNRNYAEVSSNAYWTNNFTFEAVEEYSDTVSKGYIIKQSVQAESQVNAGTKIVLTVSKGVEQFELPPVIGMDYEDAKKLLAERKFSVAKEESENDGTHTEGTVQAVVNLVVGKSYPKGTKVTLIVWGAAPEEITVTDAPDFPDTPGYTEAPDEPVEDTPATQPGEQQTDPVVTEPPTTEPVIIPTEAVE
ncbi:MAG: PASTA domain-containing protein [Clostridia bacterium]|nr:PASTA domain-containing protein [Clostridia bacterium]